MDEKSTADPTSWVRKANERATNHGRYTYDSVLGQGGFGSVLKACDNKK